MGATSSLSVSRPASRGAQRRKRTPTKAPKSASGRRKVPGKPTAARGQSCAPEDPEGAEPIPQDLACRMLAAAAWTKNGQHVCAIGGGGQPRLIGGGGQPRLRLAAPQRPLGRGESVRVTAIAREVSRDKGHLLGKRGRVTRVSEDAAQYQVELLSLGTCWFFPAELEPVKFAWPAASSDCGWSCSEATSVSTTCSSPRSQAVMDEAQYEF